MSRKLDLTRMLSPTANMGAIGDTFYQGYRQRPTHDGARWLFEEPSTGLHPPPLLTVSNAIFLESQQLGPIARRIASFLSSEFYKGRPPVPELHGSKGYGLLSELEHIHLDTFFADPDKELVQRLSESLLPFMIKKLGATHVCVVRPNHHAQQSRLSLLKFFWACQAFGLGAVPEKIQKDRTLDAILPSPQEMMQWMEVFLTFAPAQIALPIGLLGGYAIFFSSNPWIFPRASVTGMVGQFTSSVPLTTSDDYNTMMQGVRFRADSPEKIYDYIKMAAAHVNALSWFATNPLNFLIDDQLDGQKQVQFVSAIKLLINDIRSANATMSAYARMSFCFSALDKLANLVAARLDGRMDESAAFKACFSIRTVKGLRAIARNVNVPVNAVAAEVLASQPRFLLQVQKSVRGQVRGSSQEADRLDWLWSYRNLRHGTFLRQNQFERLFVNAAGIVPSQLARALMALLFAMSASPEGFFPIFEGKGPPKG